MGGVSTGVGIFSGINTAQLITQLLAIDARPKQLVQSRILTLQQQKAAYLDINSALLALKTAATKFGTAKTFQTTRAVSSNPDVLAATAGTSASPGAFSLFVKRLTTTQQFLSRGFADSDKSGVGGLKLTASTNVNDLNAGDGFEAGEIVITDATGASETIDLSNASTVGDILDAITNAAGVSVRAEIVGDSIAVYDETTGGTEKLAIANASGSTAATSLGLEKTAATAASGQSVKGDAVFHNVLRIERGGGRLERDTALSELNGGAGVARGKIQITDAAGNAATVDLSSAVTISDVLEAINTASSIKVRAEAAGDRVTITDTNTAGAGTLTITNVAGYSTATSLGIEGQAGSGGFGGVLQGSRIRTLSDSSVLAGLNDGAGVNIRDGAADLLITDRQGTVHNVELGEEISLAGGTTTVTQTRASTIGDVINYINAQTQGKVTAALNSDGTGIVLTDTTGGSGNLIVKNGVNGRTTAADLGVLTSDTGVAASTISGRRLIASLGSSLSSNLNGGSGITETALSITSRKASDPTVNITLSASALTGSLFDITSEINAALSAQSVSVRVRVNSIGNGLEVIDSTGVSDRDLVVSGAAAAELGIATAGTAASTLRGTDLDARWIGRATLLSSLNAGKGIGTGSFRITTSDGQSRTFTVTSSQKTVDDLIQLLDGGQGLVIGVSINDTGDGLLVEDGSGGTGDFKIEDVSGGVARALNFTGGSGLVGRATKIDGSYERRVLYSATDSLSTLAGKISAANVGVTAGVVNDGAGGSPYRITLTSGGSGAAGRLIVDTGALDLGLTQMADGDDAVALLGNADPAKGVLITSSTNTLDNVLPGVTIDLKQASGSAVQVTVTRDTDGMETTINDFITAFNGALDRMARYDSFNSETQTRGVLFGDSTLASARSSLLSMAQGEATGVSGQYQRLFHVGVRIGTGNRLTFDRDKFRAAIQADPTGVRDLFSAKALVPKEPVEIFPGITVENTTDEYSQMGVAEQLARLAENLTRSADGTFARKTRTIDTQVEQSNRRIESLDARLAVKRTRYERQFLAMERAIGSLQQQQAALASFTGLR